jgi:hypothetical protein
MQRPPNDYDLLPRLRELLPSIAKRVGPADHETGCQEWVGAFTHNRYGTYSIAVDGASRSVRAHRAVFMLYHGRRIAQDMTLHHLCHNTRCVNPAHLVEMTQGENNAADATGGASIRYRETKAGVPRWSVLFRENGKQRSRVFGTLEAAERYAAQRKQMATA